MSDIFISYARADRSKAQFLANALEQQGWSVWWDLNVRIGGKFDQVIKEELDAAKCVIALWSSSSIKSEWVKDEAAEAVKRGVLVPALIEDVEIPFGFGFRRIQAAWLVDWDGALDHQEFIRLLNDIAVLIEKPRTEIEIIQPRSNQAPASEQTNEQMATGPPKQIAAQGKESPVRAAPSFESSINRIKRYKLSIVAALAAIVIAGIAFAVYTPGRDSRSDVSFPFRPAYESYKAQLGSPKSSEQSAGEMPYQAAHERAIVFWAEPLVGFYKIPLDQNKPWEFESDPIWDDQTTDWGDEKVVNQLLNPPKGKKAPRFGVASHWHKDPEKWNWIGWLTWDCLFSPDKVFFQDFEHGRLIGPLRTSGKLEKAHVLVILEDRSWHVADFRGSIPVCR